MDLMITFLLSFFSLSLSLIVPILMNIGSWNIFSNCISIFGVYPNSKIIFPIFLVLSAIFYFLWLILIYKKYQKRKGIKFFTFFLGLALCGISLAALFNMNELNWGISLHSIGTFTYFVALTISIFVSCNVFNRNSRIRRNMIILGVLATLLVPSIFGYLVYKYGDGSGALAEVIHTLIIIVWTYSITIYSDRNLI